MPLVVLGLGKAEQAELLGRTAAAESDRHPAVRQQVGDRDLFSNIERVVQVETDDRRPQPDVPGLASQMEREQ